MPARTTAALLVILFLAFPCAAGALAALVWHSWWLGLILLYVAARLAGRNVLPGRFEDRLRIADNAAVVIAVTSVLAVHWLPLGPGRGAAPNTLFTGALILGLMLFFQLFQKAYPVILRQALEHKKLALLPVLTSRGRGADIMVPMAIPSFGGMCIAILSVFIVPIQYCWMEENKLKRREAAS
ncbi:MAG: hypothetical protein ACOZEN_03115 [Thermodesulfobacteriota bacterium]